MTEEKDIMKGRAISTWRIALVMWPNASLRNHGKHEVVTVNTIAAGGV